MCVCVLVVTQYRVYIVVFPYRRYYTIIWTVWIVVNRVYTCTIIWWNNLYPRYCIIRTGILLILNPKGKYIVNRHNRACLIKNMRLTRARISIPIGRESSDSTSALLHLNAGSFFPPSPFSSFILSQVIQLFNCKHLTSHYWDIFIYYWI